MAGILTPGAARRAKLGSGTETPSHGGLSVVIPTLNAADTLAATLSSTYRHAAEVIVVDGGSADSTPEIARRYGARVLTASPGRGRQLAAAVAVARGSWFLLLHADTRLTPAWIEAARAHRLAGPGRAGYFRFVLDSAARQARWLERAVEWRCRLLALPYGDQGLLIHRDLLAEIGGIRPLPLMEDVDLILRLGSKRLAQLPASAVTSAAKWERDGWFRRSARNLLCLMLYFLGLPPRRLVRIYR